MHRLLLGAGLPGAVLLCTCLVAGCRRGEKEVESAAHQRSVTSSSADNTTAAAPRAAQEAAGTTTEKIAEKVAEKVDSANVAAGQNASATPAPARGKSASSSEAMPPAGASGVAGQSEPKPPAGDSMQADNGTAAEPEPTAAWSTQRLIVLAPGGPKVIDLRINVQGKDLATGLAETTTWLGQELEFDVTAPISWEALLEKPLVKSGWFGNLVPSPEQRADLLSMYDKENTGTVDTAEFQEFFTRGLSRRDHLRLIRGQAAPELVRSVSPWGPLDQDNDGQLNEEELSDVTDALMHFDFDGDAIVSERELRSTSEAMAEGRSMTRTGGLLDLALVLAADTKQPNSLERAVHEHYTFADVIPRDAFFGWPDRRWNAFDADSNQEITKRELAPLHDTTADAQVDIALPSSLGSDDNASDISVVCNAPSQQEPQRQVLWTKGRDGGRLLLPGCVLLVRVRDDHSWQARRIACQQLARALEDPQLAAGLAGPFELKEGAWDLLRQEGADEVSRGWKWLVGPRHFHLATGWTAVERPWFELLDANDDRRLTAQELSEFSAKPQRWDQNLNGKLDEDELPMVISLTVAREDSRFGNLSAGGTNMEKGGASNGTGPSWFAGMDYNSDGEVTHGEFLGDETAFKALDANGDGIIDVREVYAPH